MPGGDVRWAGFYCLWTNQLLCFTCFNRPALGPFTPLKQGTRRDYWTRLNLTRPDWTILMSCVAVATVTQCVTQCNHNVINLFPSGRLSQTVSGRFSLIRTCFIYCVLVWFDLVKPGPVWFNLVRSGLVRTIHFCLSPKKNKRSISACLHTLISVLFLFVSVVSVFFKVLFTSSATQNTYF